jgi:nicotinate-nucleotide adenylyltransferase
VGHVAALRAAAATGRFDRIEVTVAGDPYQKTIQRAVRPALERLALARAAFGDIELVSVSDSEVRREGPSYTIDTVRELLVDALSVDVLIGADVAADLEHWHEARALADLVKVGIFPRPGSGVVFPPSFLCYEISMPPVDISSTEVRQLDGESLETAVPAEIVSLLHPSVE